MNTTRGAGSRRLIAAAHVAGDGEGGIDWDATMAFRHHLWDHGLGVAEAMDTAQRGSGLDWPLARALIERTVGAAQARGADVVCGAATDQLAPGADPTIAEIADAYVEQCEAIEGTGGRVVVMASRHLARGARGAAEYEEVYGRVLAAVSQPVILHWLGTAFDQALTGYWGAEDLDEATATCLRIIADNRDGVDGIKLSLLDREREVGMRRSLPDGVAMYTGDDYNYPELIRGDEHGHSHALLGVLDPIASVVPQARAALEDGDPNGFESILAPTLPLARHLFAPPTQHYKTGVVWLAYLNGHQERFTMLARAEDERSEEHLWRTLELAEQAGVILDPDEARQRAVRALGRAARAPG